MWTVIEGAISDEAVNATLELVDLADAPAEVERHFRVEGKTAFLTPRGMRRLRLLLAEISRAVDLEKLYREPAVAHAFFLIKSRNGPATKLHQDRGYWQSLESRPTMATFWIALEDVGPENGGLLLDPAHRISADEIARLNDPSQPLYDHERDHYGAEKVTAFATVIAEPEASRVSATLEPVRCRRGDLVIFDSLEAHESAANTQADRLAMKIVIGERDEMKRSLIPLDALLRTGSATFPVVSSFYGAKERLRRFL